MILLTTCLTVAAAAAPSAPRTNVLLVTVDTLRPDALGWVAGRNATPALDRLAREGFRFPAAVSPAPVTLPSHASILTALGPPRHGVRDNGQVLPEGVTTLAEALGKQGYATAAFVSGFPLAAPFGLDRGFQHFDDRLPDGPAERRERRAGATTAAAGAWIASAREPWLAWVHYYDPHDPYEPPAAYRRAGPRGDYDGEAAFVDYALGGLLRGLASGARRPVGRVLTVFTADHGESLGEHGESTHGFFIYESTLAVPLVFHLPGTVAPGESRAPARLVDLAPTILELVGAPPLPAADGVSLAPSVAGRAQRVPPAYAETRRPWLSYGWSPLRALRDGDWKLIDAPRPEIYDLRVDPGETENRITTERPRAERMKALLARIGSAPRASARAVSDPDAAERLRALGYVGAAGAGVSGEPPPGLPDPKDRLAEWNTLGEAEGLLGRRDYGASLARFDRVLASDPNNRYALSRSGAALLELGRGEEALRRMQRAVRSGPEHPEARLALASALGRLGRHAAAIGHWSELSRLQPREPAHWAGLGSSLGLAGQPARAATAFERAVRLAPRDPDLRVRLGFAHHAAGRAADAAEQLARASALSPPGRFAHSGALGVLLAKLGRGAEARRWLAASRPGEPDFAEARVQLALLELGVGDREAARRALGEALAASPGLRPRLSGDARLSGLLP